MTKPVEIQRMKPPSQNDVLQPLREIGLDHKTRFWDIGEIQAALRAAHSRGICPESLASQYHDHSPATFHEAGWSQPHAQNPTAAPPLTPGLSSQQQRVRREVFPDPLSCHAPTQD